MRWIKRLVGAAGVLLVLRVTIARAEPVAVSDFYGEPEVRDQAGAVALLVRTLLDTEATPVVGWKVLADAITSVAGEPRKVALVVRPVEVQRVLREAKAGNLVSATIERRGARLSAITRVFDASGSVVRAFRTDAPYGEVSALAQAIAEAVAPSLHAQPGRVRAMSAGDLRAFALALRALLSQDYATAVEALVAGDSGVAARSPPARDIAQGVWERPELALPDRVRVALAGGDPAQALALLEGAAEEPWVIAARVRARLAMLDIEWAQGAMALVADSREPDVLLARADLARRRADMRALRDAMAPLLADPPFVPGLPLAAELSPGILGGELETRALAAAAWARRDYPAVSTALALRAAQASPIDAALALIDVFYLDPRERGVAAEVADAVMTEGRAQGFRIAAAVAIASGELARARELVDRGLAVSGDQLPELHLYRAWLLEESGELAEAAVAFAAAGDARAHALGSRAAGVPAAAIEVDDTSVASLRARAATLLEAGDAAGAVALLEQAALLSPEDQAVLHELKAALLQAGETDKAKAVELAALELDKQLASEAKLAAAEGKKVSEAALASTRLGALASELASVLAGLEGLGGPAAKAILLVPHHAEDPPFWRPFRVFPERLGLALEEVLTAPPLSRKVSIADDAVGDPVPRGALGKQAKVYGATSVLLYRVRGAGSRARVTLSYYALEDPGLETTEQVIDGDRHELVGLNLRFWQIAVMLAIALIAYIAFVLVRGRGTVLVRVTATGSAGARALLYLAVTKSSRPPTVVDATLSATLAGGDARAATASEARAARAQRRRAGKRAAKIENPVTLFRGVPAGTYWVHLYGTYKHDNRELKEEQSAQVIVKREETVQVEFGPPPTCAVFMFRIVDGKKPVGDAKITDDGPPEVTVQTNTRGEGQLALSPGPRVIRIAVGNKVIGHPVDVSDTELHDVHIDLMAH